MSEFFLELFSEEIPSNLQKNLRENLLKSFNEFFLEKSIKFKKNSSYSTPNRLLILFEGVEKKIVLKSELNIPPVKVLEKFSKEITSGLGWWRMVVRLFDTPDDTILANKYRLCDTVLNLLSEATSKGLKCSVDQPEKALSLIQILQEDSTCQEDIFNDSNYFSGSISQPQSKR